MIYFNNLAFTWPWLAMNYFFNPVSTWQWIILLIQPPIHQHPFNEFSFYFATNYFINPATSSSAFFSSSQFLLCLELFRQSSFHCICSLFINKAFICQWIISSIQLPVQQNILFIYPDSTWERIFSSCNHLILIKLCERTHRKIYSDIKEQRIHCVQIQIQQKKHTLTI